MREIQTVLMDYSYSFMQLSHLSLTNIRNYSRLEFTIPSGITLLYGANAQGKTNILEAIYYLATTRSPFSEHDRQMLNWSASTNGEPVVVGRIKATIESERTPHDIEIRLIQENRNAALNTQSSFRREVLYDKRKVRLMDLLGKVKVVMFLPSDIQLITGPPANRRKFLNITLCQIDPIYCRTLSQYNKVLEQRNALLRQIGEGVAKRDLLPIYTERLVTFGALLFSKRAQFLKFMTKEGQRVQYESLSAGRETLRIVYLPKLTSKRLSGQGEKIEAFREWMNANMSDETAVETKFRSLLSQLEEHDVMRGTTTVGPHRDDWEIQLNNHNISYFGSRGQQRSAILALKIAEIEWMTQQTGEKPILLLDEVVAELDSNRRASLLATILESSQAIVTATEPSMFSDSFLKKANTFQVSGGQIQATSEVDI